MAAGTFPFTKMQAVGNDFVVVDAKQWHDTTNWSRAAVRLCDRKFGIGSDGLIVVTPGEATDVRMAFFNPDGTPDRCGNGLRCIAEWAFQRSLLHFDDDDCAWIESRGSFHRVRRKTSDPAAPGEWLTTMGVPQFAPWEVPVIVDGDEAIDYLLTVEDRTFTVSSVSTGTAHTVLFVDTFPDDATFLRYSPLIENHPFFPERTSVMWAFPDPQAPHGDGYLLRIWERGAGETLGCGTGACAVGVVARKTGRTHAPLILLASRGGGLAVSWSPDDSGGQMVLMGPAQTVYTGTVAFDAED